QFGRPAAAAPEALARSKGKFVNEVRFDDMLHVLAQTFLLERVTEGVVEIRRKLSLGLLGVGERLTPGVIDLIVVAVTQALPYFGLESVIIRPTAAADVIGHKGVRISRQEEAGAESSKSGCRCVRADAEVCRAS